MPGQVVFALRVRRWLRDELSYLAERSPAAERRLHERVATMTRLLGEYPRIGVAATKPGMRRLVISPYVVTYRQVGDNLIEIIDMRHSRQAERPIPEVAP